MSRGALRLQPPKAVAQVSAAAAARLDVTIHSPAPGTQCTERHRGSLASTCTASRWSPLASALPGSRGVRRENAARSHEERTQREGSRPASAIEDQGSHDDGRGAAGCGERAKAPAGNGDRGGEQEGVEDGQLASGVAGLSILYRRERTHHYPHEPA